MSPESAPPTAPVTPSSASSTDRPPGVDRSAALVMGLATAVGMWAIGYVFHLPGLRIPPQATLPVMVAAMVGGGVWVVRRTGSVRTAAAAGAVTSVVNLMILGGVLTSGGEGESAPTRGLLLLFSVGFVATGATMAALGGALGRRLYDPNAHLSRPHGWPSLFAKTAVVATFLLIVIGGVVTSEEAGLAVPDWPNSFGSNMFLYPLSKMIAQNDVYYEHAHRLFGSMVGLTVLLMALFFWRRERGWLAAVAGVALVLVIVQGLLGGMRVEQANLWEGDVAAWKRGVKGAFDALALDADRLRVVHGVLGQLFFGLLVAIAAFSSRAWRGAERLSHRFTGMDRGLSVFFLVAVVGQLVLGAITRHVQRDPTVMIHLAFAFVVAGLGIVLSFRRLALSETAEMARRTGAAVGALLLAQLALGFAALALTAGEDSTAATLVATGHQATGAAILGLAVLDVAWVFRLRSVGTVAPPPEWEVADGGRA